MRRGNPNWDLIIDDPDPKFYAGILKLWCRQLPLAPLESVSYEVARDHQTVKSIPSALEHFPIAERAFLLWLWDFCAEVTFQK